PDFYQRIEAITKLAPSAPGAPNSVLGPNDPAYKGIQQLIREMSKAGFSPERIQQLMGQLRQHGKERPASGDHETARKVFAANLLLEMYQEPTQNPFLNLLCFVSLRFLSPDGNDSVEQQLTEETKA